MQARHLERTAFSSAPKRKELVCGTDGVGACACVRVRTDGCGQGTMAVYVWTARQEARREGARRSQEEGRGYGRAEEQGSRVHSLV